MAEEKKLTEKEQKAKEYADFYYFWLFHYCGRNFRREIDQRLPPQPQENSLEALTVIEQRQDLAQEIYWGHPLSSMYPQFSPDSDYTDVDDLFEQDCAPGNEPSTILEKLYNGQPLRKNIEHIQGYGVEILGTSGAHISTDGHLRGSLIAKIDLRAPISSILFELSKLKETKFESFPNFLDAPQFVGLPGNYLYQKDIIKQTTNSSFAVKDDAPRAIGLWFWDAIDGPNSLFVDFAEAWKAIDGEPVPRLQYEEPEAEGIYRIVFPQGNPSCESWAVPTKKVFARLDKSASEPAVFRRLYRNTKRCIDACEVLSLAD